MRLVNYIKTGVGGKKFKERKVSKIDHIVIHRCAIAGSAHETVHKFQTELEEYQAGWYTGGKTPYHFYIEKDGLICQLLPITYVAPGAPGLNGRGIQIACSGDYRTETPKPKLVLALQDLVNELQAMLRYGCNVVGHTEKKGHSIDLSKECPGQHLRVEGFKQGTSLLARIVL